MRLEGDPFGKDKGTNSDPDPVGNLGPNCEQTCKGVHLSWVYVYPSVQGAVKPSHNHAKAMYM